MRTIGLIVIIFSSCLVTGSQAQSPTYHFSKLTVNQGLNDGMISAITQDKYGYMWFASLGGLNRYNGYSMKLYSHTPGDSTSPLGNIVECMASDNEGRLWIGFETGLMEFDFKSSRFRQIKKAGNIRINQVLPISPREIYLATDQGLALFDPQNDQVDFYAKKGDSLQQKLLKTRVYSLCRKEHLLYMACGKGLFVFDTKTMQVQKLEVPLIGNAAVRTVAVDNQGNTWIGTVGQVQLLRLSTDGKATESFTHALSTSPITTVNNVNHIFRDRNDNIWVITTIDGLLEWIPQTHSFRKHLHNPSLPGTPGSNLHRSFFQDKTGTIWLGGNNGLNYFHPDKTLFNTILPFDKDLETRGRRLARGVTEDAAGNLWFATLDGVVQYNPQNMKYREWNNKVDRPPLIYYNSIRGIITDHNNNIWIATGAGVNRYNPAQNRMEFVDKKDLPGAFYFSANTDSKGRIWFGCRDGYGFYWYDPGDKSFHDIGEHPQLKQFSYLGGRYFLEDSRGRYWFGFNGSGLGMYNPASGETNRWHTSDGKIETIIGNQVVDIKEDKKGVIWISTTNGITGIHPDGKKIQSFNSRNGLLSNTASALGVDSLDRLWIATSRGINMLDSGRTIFTSFGIQDGLPTSEFPEHPGYIARDGDFIFPSYNGYVRFDPLQFRETGHPLSTYMAGLKVFNENYPVTGEISDLENLHLGSNQNAFTLEFVALNFDNPNQTWYAYKLDGFDKDWTYTRNHEASYTNVPGGSYQFRFKATTNPNDWEVPEKRLSIRVDTVFYRTWWFIGLLILVSVALLYGFYRFRLRQQKQVLVLKNKSQLLEKEKTQVLYESLKQQLNPHFLFNSLTSLRSLIRSKPQHAGEFLDGLSRSYRYILKSRDHETVSLADELKFTETYVQLQQTRFPKGFDVRIYADEESLYRKIVPVTLQNLLENAIKHNLIDAESPLVVEIAAENGWLVVRNNLQRKEFVETSNKQGLESLRTLYQYLTAEPMNIQEDETHFTIKIPLI